MTERMALIAGVRHITVDHVQRWLAGAQPGATLCYAVGFNAEKDAGRGVAHELRCSEKSGFVYLVQRRGEQFKSLYLAQRSSRPLNNPIKQART